MKTATEKKPKGELPQDVESKIYDLFQKATPREKLLLRIFWELDIASGVVKGNFDLRDKIIDSFAENPTAKNDPDMVWYEGFISGVGLITEKA